MAAHGPAGAGAGVAPAAPAAYQTMFQINRGFGVVSPEIKALLEHYANPELQNCANLSLIYLGFVKDPDRYLDACVLRQGGTYLGEISETIEEAYKQTGQIIPPLFQVVLPITNTATYGQRMVALADELLPGHATLVGLEFANNVRHMAVLRKPLYRGPTQLRDFQMRNPDGSYPAIQDIHPDGSSVSPYLAAHPVISIYKLMGPVLSDLHLIDKLSLKLVGSLYMNTSADGGGRRRRQKSRRRKTVKKKTRKAASR